MACWDSDRRFWSHNDFLHFRFDEMGSSYLSCSFSRSILPPTHHKFLNFKKIIDMWPVRNDIGNIFVRFRRNYCASIGFKRVSKFYKGQSKKSKKTFGPYPKTSNSDLPKNHHFVILNKTPDIFHYVIIT